MRGNLKGAVIARLNLAEPHLSGVAKKLEAQRAALAAATGPVELYALAGADITCNGAVVQAGGTGRQAARRAYYLGFYRYLARQVRGLDYVYIRYPRSSPLFLWMLARLRAHNPGLVVLIELPSFPYHTENVSLRDKVFGAIDRVSRPLLRFVADRIVTFSRAPRIFGLPTIATDNGVDVAALAPLAAPPADGPLKIFGVANLSFWHGYDRLIAGLAAYRGARAVAFDIAGAGQQLARLQADVAAAGLQDVVRFHGPQHGAALKALMQGAHLGASSIGMHRLDVDTSNLKSREYCARGLPFLIAYPDRDFGDDFPFAFHAPADDSPVDIAALVAWYDGLETTHPDHRTAMRAYAEDRLSWHSKMAPVCDVVQSLAAGRG